MKHRKLAARETAQSVEIDDFDRKILSALLENGRATNVEIAAKVGLSEAPCLRRIRRLRLWAIEDGNAGAEELHAETAATIRFELRQARFLVWCRETVDAESAESGDARS